MSVFFYVLVENGMLESNLMMDGNVFFWDSSPFMAHNKSKDNLTTRSIHYLTSRILLELRSQLNPSMKILLMGKGNHTVFLPELWIAIAQSNVPVFRYYVDPVFNAFREVGLLSDLVIFDENKERIYREDDVIINILHCHLEYILYPDTSKAFIQVHDRLRDVVSVSRLAKTD